MIKNLNYSLSLSLSLSLREYRSINKKFHKTSKIKNRESIEKCQEGGACVGCNKKRSDFTLTGRAESQTRTDDLLITNQLLYQLSYFGLHHLMISKI